MPIASPMTFARPKLKSFCCPKLQLQEYWKFNTVAKRSRTQISGTNSLRLGSMIHVERRGVLSIARDWHRAETTRAQLMH
jgi:hypothetical protein